MTEFAKAIDKAKVRHYLVADTKEEIDSYCDRKKIRNFKSTEVRRSHYGLSSFYLGGEKT